MPNNEFSLADYMDLKLTQREREAGFKYMKRVGFDDKRKTEIFEFYFKGRLATFHETGREETTREGKYGELLTLNRGIKGAIYYEAFREIGGELYFLGESESQVVDPIMRNQEARTNGKFN